MNYKFSEISNYEKLTNHFREIRYCDLSKSFIVYFYGDEVLRIKASIGDERFINKILETINARIIFDKEGWNEHLDS